MGTYFLDQYSYLHFAVGILAYFWGISFFNFTVLHLLFEIIENNDKGIYIINNYITIWPGGKTKPDTIINIFGDIISSLIGFLSAYYLDKMGSKYNWYKVHI